MKYHQVVIFIYLSMCGCKDVKNHSASHNGITILATPEPLSLIDNSKIQEFKKSCQEQVHGAPYLEAFDLSIFERVCASDISFPEARDNALRAIQFNARDPELDRQLIGMIQELKTNNKIIHAALLEKGWIYFENIELYTRENGQWNIHLRAGGNRMDPTKSVTVFGAQQFTGKPIKAGKCYLSPADDILSRHHARLVKPYEQVLFVVEIEKIDL